MEIEYDLEQQNSASRSDALSTIEIKPNRLELSLADLIQMGLNYFQLQDYNQCLGHFEALNWKNYKDCAWLRKHIIAPSMNAKNFVFAQKILELIIKNHPESIIDLMTLSSVLIRQDKRPEGCVYLEKILALDKENYPIAAQLIQIKLQTDIEKAIILAKHYQYAYDFDERLLKISLQVLLKSKNTSFALNTLLNMDYSKYSLEVGILAAQIALDEGRYCLVESIFKRSQNAAYQDARIYFILAKSRLAQGLYLNEVIELLSEANKLDAENIQINSLLGDLLLKTGNYQKALIHLEKVKNLAPQNPQTRIQNAKALKFLGNYQEAAQEMLEVVKLLPLSIQWRRYAASALAQAGRHDESLTIFNEGVTLRNKALPESFAKGLEQLGDKVDAVNIPQARWDWLNAMINNRAPLNNTQNNHYKKQAMWVNLLDHFLIDWLECRPHQADEAMTYFKDLSAIDILLQNTLNQGKGIILAGAHVGPLFSIPLALELLGLPHKWLASTPKVSSMSYKDSLISTSEHSEGQIVRQIIKALQENKIIAFAIDGAINPAAPRVNFENQSITYSDFAAKISYRTQTHSFFTVCRWNENRFCLSLDPLPLPAPDEKIEAYCSRWTTSYLNSLRDYLIESPENARLSGGIWRNIK